MFVFILTSTVKKKYFGTQIVSFTLEISTHKKYHKGIHLSVKEIIGKSAEGAGNPEVMMVKTNKSEVLRFQSVISKAFGKDSQLVCAH